MNCIKNYILLYLYQHFLEKIILQKNIHYLVIVFFLLNMNFLIFAVPTFDKFRKYWFIDSIKYHPLSNVNCWIIRLNI